MTEEEVRDAVIKAIGEQTKKDPDMNMNLFDEDDDWMGNLGDIDTDSQIFIGSAGSYVLFITLKDDDLYLTWVIEAGPVLMHNDWLFGSGWTLSETDYDFSTSVYDVCTDDSFDPDYQKVVHTSKLGPA